MNTYHDIELNRYFKKMKEIESQPASQQKEEENKLLEHWTSADGIKWFADQADWILDGSYGYAEQWRAREILRMSKRANKPAALSQMTAALACGVKSATVRKLWHKLTPTQQAELTKAIADVISDQTDKLNEEEAENN